MIRGLILFLVVAAVAAGAAWLAEAPGQVSLTWLGYRIETSAAVLSGLVGAVAVVAAVLYRGWGALRRAPGGLAHAWQERTRRKGYQALSKGMVAVAAGDGDEAAKQVRRADGLLHDPPLTLLLSAQAAQLNGDEAAAARFFRLMQENKEMEFLGVRGLLTQAVKAGNGAEALRLARLGWGLQPKSAWVADQLFTQLAHAGEWAEAEAVLDSARRRKLIGRADAEGRQWVVRHQAALAAPASDALRRARKVHGARPGFVPGAVHLAGLLLDQGQDRKAAAVIEKTWAVAPHPDLLAPYWRASRAEDALSRLRAAEKLAKKNPDHEESRLALAAQALDAQLWGEARRYLGDAVTAAGDGPSARVCRLMAALEDGEGGDPGQVRHWLMQASMAAPDPAWVCGDCGHVAAAWQPSCGHCDGFDTLAWTPPPHARALAAAGETPPVALVAAPDDLAGEKKEGV